MTYLSGSIPPFANKSSLATLFLQSNKFQGSIPSSIFNLANISQINLSSNNLSGVVEFHRFSELKYLKILHLSSNSGLDFMYDHNTNYTFQELNVLFLSFCNISEVSYFVRDTSYLTYLDFSRNQFRGHIPKWFFDVAKDSLGHLNLSHNVLTHIEQIPWTKLNFLDLGFNFLQGALIIPASSLRVLSISNNQLTEEISPSNCNQSSIQILGFSKNRLSGNLPQCMGNFSKQLTVLDMHMNRLHGTIPSTFTKECL